MSKRPIPMLKMDDELNNFINETKTNYQENIVKKNDTISNKDKKRYIKKSLVLSEDIDNALRLESAKSRLKQINIMEKAIAQYLRDLGYKNI